MRIHGLLLATLAGSLLSAEPPAGDWLQAIPHRSAQALQALEPDLARIPEARDRAYWTSLADYQRVWATRGRDPKGAQARLEAAIQRLEGATDPEAMGLQGACWDLLIGFNRAKALIFAPRAARLLQTAEQTAPDSPRIQVFLGIHCIHIPALFGGGHARAIAHLERALAASTREAELPAASPWVPRWGRPEALAWLAVALEDEGRKPETMVHAQEALALDPGYRLPQAILEDKP